MTDWNTIDKAPAQPAPVELFYGNLVIAGLRVDLKLRDPRRAIGYFDGLHFREGFTGHRAMVDGDEDAVTHWRPLQAVPVTD